MKNINKKNLHVQDLRQTREKMDIWEAKALKLS